MRKYLQCLAIISVMAAYGYSNDATSDSASNTSKNVMKTLEHIMAKAGISFDGEFQSQFMSAEIGGSAVDNTRRKNETVEFTSVDFDIKARPNTITQGRLIFRMQQDWRNFYSDVSNPIFTRWISIDGSLKGMFSYNVGDFRQKYTPLTLYTPDIDILYEPDLFSRQREVAKNEVFLDDNQRLLQGVNLNFGAEVYPVFNALKLNVLATRLRSVQTDIQNGSKVAGFIEASPIEKFMVGTNGDATFLKGITVGGSYLNIFDNTESYNGYGGDSAADTMAQNTVIGDIRGGVDLAAFVDAKNWKAGLSAEMAMSSDDSSSYDTTGNKKSLITKTISGSALRAGIAAAYTLQDVFSVSLDAGYINNTSDYRNELAQTPDFFGRRIMDFENDNPTPTNTTINSPLYSTFDALYQQVFKFAPSPKDNYNGNATWWYKEPFSKNSYTPMVMTQSELSTSQTRDTSKFYNYLKSQYLDPAVQLIMPFGPATPNRTGISGHVNLGFLGNRLQAKVLFASLKDIDTTIVPGALGTSTESLPKSTYSQLGGGFKVDVGAFIGWKYPINLSSSVVSSKASNDGNAKDTANYPAASVTSTFFSENLYFKFWKRMAFLAGMEIVNNQFAEVAEAFTNTQNQVLTAIGLEYKVSEGSYVTGTVGQIDVTYKSDDPLYIGASDPSRMNFNQKIVSLFLRVMF